MVKTILTIQGKDYHTVHYHTVVKDDYFLAYDGSVQQFHYEGPSSTEVLIVVPVPVEHIIGGVVFEPTGEHRHVRRGEWFLFVDKRSSRPYDFEEFRHYDLPCVSVGKYEVYRAVRMAPGVC